MLVDREEKPVQENLLIPWELSMRKRKKGESETLTLTIRSGSHGGSATRKKGIR